MVNETKEAGGARGAATLDPASARLVQNQFKVGDVCRLRSGGPGMTVAQVWPRSLEKDEKNMSDTVHCVWFDDQGHLQRATFNNLLLTK